MKRKIILSALLAVVLISQCLFFSIGALDIDGTMNENQWKNAESYILISSDDKSNCGVDNAVVSVLADESSNQLHLGFKVKLSESVQGSAAYGAAVSVNSGEFIYITPSGVSSFDRDKLSVESAVYAYSDSAFCVEVTLGLKYGLDTLDKLDVRLIDAQGSPSNVCNVKLGSYVSNTTYITETEKAVAVTTEAKAIEQHTEKPEKTEKAEKTTRQSTTKARTTKADSKRTTTRKFAINADGYTETVASTTLNSYAAVTGTNADELESVTTLNAKQMKLQKGLSYAAVAAIILLALGICVAVNLARDKKEKTSDKKS